MSPWMDNLFTNNSTSLVDLLFHLPLILSVLVTSLVVSLVRKKRQSLYSKMVFKGLDFLMAFQFLLIILHGLNWLNLLPINYFLPPLDRAVSVFSYVWIIWIWAAILPEEKSTRLLVFSNIVVLALLGYSIYRWNLGWKDSFFNLSPLDWTWQFLSLGVLAAGIVLILYNRHKRWGIGLLILLINLAGHVFFIFSRNTTADYPIEVRLSQLLSFPLLFFIAARFQHRPYRAGAPVQSSNAPQLHLQPIADPAAVISWIKTAAVDTLNDEVYTLLLESTAHTMQADACLLASNFTSDTRDFKIQGFDRFHGRIIPSKEIKRDFLPTISATMQRGDALYLSAAGSLPVDAYILSEILGFEQSGDILLSPVFVKNQLWGSLVILSPYTLRFWSPEEQSFFHATARKVGEILTRVMKTEPSVEEILHSTSQAQSVNEAARLAPDRVQAVPFQQGTWIEQASPSADLILATEEIARLKSELRQARDRLMILELDTTITDQEVVPGQTDAWQSEIDQWINIDQTEPQAAAQPDHQLPLSISELISQVIDDLQSEIAARRLTMQLNLSGNTWTSSEDEGAVESLLTGLVKHIIHMTPSNGIVRISSQPTTQPDQPAATIKLDSIHPEHAGNQDVGEAKDNDQTEEDKAQVFSQLDEMKTITASLGGSFFMEGEPGFSTMIKVILPASSPADII